ncbi:MAG: TetR/AcrR family transcriptional regulator [Flavobacteriales bacterium]|nr:TetR/AcrR family transcriptional regulator [Flavobacteriia bacterium]NCP06331.1 TetR/AcrR family transcriptional regulator [Flavobacteriales bacterium]PIV94331.1 MAG: TetR family transcriptional regulator [Flavobacteriaceae bacterium CG17_big_fil_post_rev_8_21_14_2_50_33_15]PIY13249.1 MAG: TetR family transcriptional regulator [Flavobacteriaceae bacterium CG_4_10_14_3_um_filter_33_47]PJB18634.1 MAG: TetR family transcriptional regulator [Flavobacteriaceae bacterium CG_4_9_14_3_um_filter_33_1
MKNLLATLKITVPEKIFLKDPETSDLGKKIIEHSIILIDQIGFDNFTFKKLGTIIGSNESSIYRYFESKHKLLLYLTSWYWAWIEYQMVFETYSIAHNQEKLLKAIDIVTRTVKEDSNYSHINEVLLNRIIINENSKSFLTKEVDQENKDGYFMVYKRLVYRLKDMILEVTSDYKYASSLASNIIEGSLYQHFLKDHFTSITDCKQTDDITTFFSQLTINLLK